MLRQSLQAFEDSRVLLCVRYRDPAESEGEDVFSSPLGRTETVVRKQLHGLAIQAAASQRRLHRRLLDPRCSLLALPLVRRSGGNETIGLIADETLGSEGWVEATQGIIDRYQIEQLQRELEHHTGIARHSAATVELVAALLRAADTRQASGELVRRLADHLNVPRVSLGWIDPFQRCRLIAVNHAGTIHSAASATRALEACMNQALADPTNERVANESQVSKPDRDVGGGLSGDALPLDDTELPSRITAVLRDDGVAAKAVVVAELDERSDAIEVRRFLSAASPALAAALQSIDQSTTRSVTALWLRSVRCRGAAALTLMLLIAAVAMWVPVPYRPGFSADLEPSTRRFVVAPFDATLLESRVSPGDRVRSGDVLAVLDGRDLRLQRETLRADFEQAVKKRDAAQASRAYGQHRLAQLEVDRLRLQLELLDHRLNDLTVTSPIDGVVVSGDLDRVRGMPLETGQSLFEIAPLDRMTFQIAVPDADVALVRPGQPVTLRLAAFSDRVWQTVVRRVHPRSELRDQQNVFIAECSVDDGVGELRPGMKGDATLDCGTRSLGWVLFHRPVRALRQWGWW
jgi:multidrug efflux pump subunit AcrA (membrane-fusion protein)